MTKHKKGYEDECVPPFADRKWKLGQVWACACGNMFRVVEKGYGTYTYKSWENVNP